MAKAAMPEGPTSCYLDFWKPHTHLKVVLTSGIWYCLASCQPPTYSAGKDSLKVKKKKKSQIWIPLLSLAGFMTQQWVLLPHSFSKTLRKHLKLSSIHSIPANQLSDNYNPNTELIKGIASLRELLKSQDLEESQGRVIFTTPEQRLLCEQTSVSHFNIIRSI